MSKKQTYTNRKGVTYYLREVSGKRGTRITCSTNESPDDLTAIPGTHEIVENPNGQVSCRKKMKYEITPEEISYTENLCSSMVDPRIRLFIEKKTKAIVIHSADTTDISAMAQLAIRLCSGPTSTKAIIENNLHYEAVLKLELVDKKERRFAVSRMCWIGGDNDWLYLDEGQLPVLLEEYVPHIGQESFYELI